MLQFILDMEARFCNQKKSIRLFYLHVLSIFFLHLKQANKERRIVDLKWIEQKLRILIFKIDFTTGIWNTRRSWPLLCLR